MKGILFKKEDVWHVNYVTETFKVNMIPLHPDFAQYFNEPEFEDMTGKEVEFEIVDEFIEPSLYEGVPIFEGQPYAKLI